jgi:hypothetical protein
MKIFSFSFLENPHHIKKRKEKRRKKQSISVLEAT